MGNTLKYSLNAISYTFITLTIGGSLLQIYLIEQGLSDEKTALFFSIMRAIQTATILLVMHLASYTRRAAPGSAFPFFAALPFCIFLLSLTPSADIPQLSLYLFGSVFYVAIGAYCIFSYRLPYTTLHMESYGQILGITGAISAALGLAVSLAITLLQNIFSFFRIMRGVFILSACVSLIGIISTVTLRERIADRPRHERPRVHLLTYRPFRSLIVANLLRGITGGVITIAVTLGYAVDLLDAHSATLSVIITGVATMLASLLFSYLSKKVHSSFLILLSAIAAAAAMPFLLIGNTVTFFIFLALITFFVAIEDIAVPVAVSSIVHVDIIARYTGGRMLLHTLGTSLASYGAVMLLAALSPFSLMLLTGVVHLIFATIYYQYFKNKIRRPL